MTSRTVQGNANATADHGFAWLVRAKWRRPSGGKRPERTGAGLSSSRLSNVVANGKPDEVGQRVEVELAHDRGPVCLHRLHAQVQPRRNRLVAVPLGQELNDLPLPRGEPLGPERDRLGRPTPFEEAVQN